MRRLVIIGPPGSGKSTQAQRLSAEYNLAHLSTGQLLRDEIALGTAAGSEAQGYISQGLLAPTPLVNAILHAKLLAVAEAGFILDGYPRTIDQIGALDEMLASLSLPLDAALLIAIAEEVAIARLGARLVCSNCRASYITGQLPDGSVCPQCGGVLVRRDDDRPEVIHERFVVYHTEMAPVLNVYRERDLLIEIDGQGEVDDVYARLKQVVDRNR